MIFLRFFPPRQYSDESAEIAARCFGFVFPSRGEGIANARPTCLSIGLYPFLPRHTGVAPPDGCGGIPETCSLEEIDAVEAGVREAVAMKKE